MNTDTALAPLISICIPAYKRAAYLQRLLKSIATQTFKDFEVIVTDDSPDDTVSEILQKYQKFFKTKYKKNLTTLGTPENWNEGLRMADGKWIKIMHDDDWFASSQSLEKFVELINNNPKAAFLFSGSAFVRNDKIFGGMHISRWQLTLLKEGPSNLYFKNFIGPPSVILHLNSKDIWYDPNMKWLVDVDFYMRYLQKHSSFSYTTEPLINVGYSEDQVTEKVFHDKTIFVKENLMMMQKQPHDILRKIWNYDYTWRMMRNHKIKDSQELQELYPAGADNIPAFHTSILDFQKFIPHSVLKIGLFSKILMAFSFVIIGLRK